MADGSGSFRRKLTPKQIHAILLERHEPALAAAFMEAIDNLRAGAQIRLLERALASGDIETALRALNLDEFAFEQLLEELRAAYLDAGQQSADGLPRTVGRVRFSGRNPRAEAWLRDHSASFVTRLLEDQRQAVRQSLVDLMQRGAAPRTGVTAIVGPVSRVTGRREGGILGLSAPQEASVRLARQQLESADPATLRAYLARSRRDRRFDRSITKALREGRPVEPAIAARAVTAYERRLLALRAETIARTEAMSALGAAQDEALRQAVESGSVQAFQIRRVWRSASDLRVRHTHRDLNGDSVGLDETFMSPSGATLRYPGDPSAPTSERVNCRCWLEPRIDYFANLR